MGDVVGGILAIICLFLIWAAGVVLSVGVFVGAIYLVFKIFGIDIEGFTA